MAPGRLMRAARRAAWRAMVAGAVVSSGTGLLARALAAQPAGASAAGTITDDAPPPLREFRGAWVASVSNLDWPSKPGLPVAQQQQELLAILDRAVELRLNAIIFQVRPGGDALYRSSIEPWSYFLTGQQGRAPVPMWDPLQFAIEEAHARGLELHAWFNPYRARHPDDKSPHASTHLARRNPSLVKRYGTMEWMDPGSATVRRHTIRVITDVVKRYDVDGIHLDDYFYPYRERNRRGRAIPFPDDATYKAYRRAGGKLSRDDWRRRNVDVLVKELDAAIHEIKPSVRFGISPFGIWRPGYPASVRGLDPYTELYADSKKWLDSAWVDYFVPQLYWTIGAPAQSYPVLLRWWVEQNAAGRHIWAGNFTDRVGGAGSTRWPATELVAQVEATRAQPGATGNVHFSMRSLMTNRDGLIERLLSGPYAQQALVPASPWLSRTRPAAPVVAVTTDSAVGQTTVTMETRSPRTRPWLWVVQARFGEGWSTFVVPGRERSYTFAPTRAGDVPASVVVRAIDRVGNESPAVQAVSAAAGAPAGELRSR